MSWESLADLRAGLVNNNKKTRSAVVIGFIAMYRCGLLRQHELNAGLNRIVVAPEDRNCCERSVLAIRVPALLERRLALALESLAAHRRSEHAALAPAPHFLAGKILHDEVVSLTVGESQLEHLGRVVLDAEREFQLVRIFPGARDVERRHDRRGHRGGVVFDSDRFFVMGRRGRGKRDG